MDFWRFAVGIMLMTAVAGPVCASEDDTPGATPAPSAEAPAGDESAAGAAEDAQEEVKTIMDLPLDGSSKQAFEAGLTAVDEQATETQYRSLMSSLDYLLFYDLAVRRDRAKLYEKLSGQTPNQIIQEVRNQKGGTLKKSERSKSEQSSKRVSPDHRKRRTQKDS